MCLIAHTAAGLAPISTNRSNTLPSAKFRGWDLRRRDQGPKPPQRRKDASLASMTRGDIRDLAPSELGDNDVRNTDSSDPPRPAPSGAKTRPGPGRPDGHRRRVDDRQRHLRPALADGRQRRSRPAAHRLGDHRRRHADAGLRLPDPGDPQAGRRRRCLRLRPRRVRQLHRLHVGLRLLGVGLGRQRGLPRPAVLDAGLLLPRLRGRRNRSRDHRRVGRAVDRARHDPARRPDRRRSSTSW